MKYIFANLKMYLDFDEENILLRQILSSSVFNEFDGELALFPTALAFSEFEKRLADSRVTLGAQNIYYEEKGAFTGEVSAKMYKDLGAKYALVGHSERRKYFCEDEETLMKKLQACEAADVIPVLCVGESQEDFEAGKRKEKLEKQLQVLQDYTGDLFIAYEPVWAIGTGDADTPEDAAEMISFIKEYVQKTFDKQPKMLYGGSVKPQNVVSYREEECIDGLLIGSASTKFDVFEALLKNEESI